MRSNKKLSDLRIPSNKKSDKSPSVAFRTIIKCRNDSIVPPTLLETSQIVEKARSTSRTSHRNQNISSAKKIVVGEGNLKEYVKHMKMKKEDETHRSELNDNEFAQMKLSRVSSTSKLSTSCLRDNLNTHFKPIPMDQMQRRIQNLLAAKLEKLSLHKSGVGLSTWEFLKRENHLEPELEELILRFKSGQQNEQGIAELCSKLEMIQKMIASEAIESELLKDRYYGFKNQRCNISSYRSKQLLATSSTLNEGSKINMNTFRSQRKGESLSKYISTNREAYSKPSKEFYVNNRYQHPPYIPNRQILPRSAYSTEFLNYGTMPTFQNRPLNAECLPSHVPLAIKASSYQQQFKDKYNLCKPMDYKELDCYKNKFKNPNISFMNNCKKTMLDTVSALKKTTKAKNEQVSESKLSKMLSHSTFSDFYKTEQKRNYFGHSASQAELSGWMKGEPKELRLNELKEMLRATYLRG